MNVATAPDVRSIEHLDQQPMCENAKLDCHNPAAWWVRVHDCGAPNHDDADGWANGLLCEQCLTLTLDRFAIGLGVRCSTCSAWFPHLSAYMPRIVRL